MLCYFCTAVVTIPSCSKVFFKTNTHFPWRLISFVSVFTNVDRFVPHYRLPSTRNINNSISNSISLIVTTQDKSQNDSVISILYWNCSVRWSLDCSRLKAAVCEGVCLSQQQTHHCHSAIARRPGTLVENSGSYPARTGKRWSVENQDVWKKRPSPVQNGPRYHLL